MKRLLYSIPLCLCLLILSSCGDSGNNPNSADTWIPAENFTFSLENAAGVGSDTKTFDPGAFDPSVINDPAYSYNPKGWLDENTVLCTRSNSDYTVAELAAVTPDGTVTKLNAEIDPYTVVSAQNGFVIFGKGYETILPDGVTFARWDGRETITTVHHFTEGTALAFQQFFSPDGTKAVMSWIPEVPGVDWNIRLIDLEAGTYQDLQPPEIQSDAPVMLLSRWLDNETVLVTASTGFTQEEFIAAWEVAVP